MTRDEIIAKWSGMTPRERDAWVAEVVFGAKIVSVADDDDFHVELSSASGIIAYTPLPRYTTDISAAWTVLGAIPGEFYLYRAGDGSFVVSFGYSCEECPDCGDDLFEVTAQGKASTAAEAIGLAAVLANLSPTV